MSKKKNVSQNFYCTAPAKLQKKKTLHTPNSVALDSRWLSRSGALFEVIWSRISWPGELRFVDPPEEIEMKTQNQC